MDDSRATQLMTPVRVAALQKPDTSNISYCKNITRVCVFDTLVWTTSIISNGPPAMTKTGTLCVSKTRKGDRCEGEKRASSYLKRFDVNMSSGVERFRVLPTSSAFIDGWCGRR